VQAHFIPALVCGLFAVLAQIGSAQATEPVGVWLVENGSAKVRVHNCGSALCGKVVWIRQPIDPETGKPWLDKSNVDPRKRGRAVLGIAIAVNMRPGDGSDHWTGHVYSVDHGKVFNGSLTLMTPSRMKIEGCIGVFCQSETWTRAD